MNPNHIKKQNQKNEPDIIDQLIVDFNMLNSEVKELEEVDTNFNFKDLISKKAQEDKQDESIGLKYLNKASEL